MSPNQPTSDEKGAKKRQYQKEKKERARERKRKAEGEAEEEAEALVAAPAAKSEYFPMSRSSSQCSIWRGTTPDDQFAV
ncbi:hypothetical protein L207DRAFT_575786 [Hyaloscypha variabilis F]|uniref:Uncharacterized protein n=1 Tax=Hyaloscypha variabilis (strain UAMH 11265 / GT02V1 / F) TaxID=1149755 RepID=A0A2J6S895_HYAVF|nr:hypothetical protein L207DRAFT_575786 [Hyaloscypha variabilis F]